MIFCSKFAFFTKAHIIILIFFYIFYTYIYIMVANIESNQTPLESTKQVNSEVPKTETQKTETKKWLWSVFSSIQLWWLFQKVTETAKDSFDGIYNAAKDWVKTMAVEVKKWAWTVVDEVKNTQTFQKVKNTAESATEKTTSTFTEMTAATLWMVWEAIKPVLDPTTVKLESQTTINDVIDLKIDLQNPKNTSEELIVAEYNVINNLLGQLTPDMDSKEQDVILQRVNSANSNLKWLISQYKTDQNRIYIEYPKNLNSMKAQWASEQLPKEEKSLMDWDTSDQSTKIAA